MDERSRRRVTTLLWVVVALDVAYWIAWYADRSLVASNTRAAYYEFENAFPVADAWLGLCAAAAAIALRRRSNTALLWLLLAGGAGGYLLGMDVLYDLENSIWWSSGAGGVIELAINLATAAVSGVLIRWTWLHRDTLLRPENSEVLDR
ncbi:MAG: hypothetical protein JO222_08075 [Frankiales bacterium]|nr:hypothetical protein [Frankiales bacterium]